jgi:hypothetical protein
MKFLTDEKRSQLIAQHKKERDKRICYRIKAVLLFKTSFVVMSVYSDIRAIGAD